MMEARPKTTKLVSNKHTGHLPALRVHDGDILVSCSGTVGNVALCTKDVDGWACSQDAIRVIAHDPTDLGPLYCFLQSALGQFLLKRSQTGSVVRHIYEADVSGLPIPKLPLALRRELTERIRKASALRVEANRLLDVAERMVQEQLGLPPMANFAEESQTLVSHSPTVFNIGVRDRIANAVGYGRIRFDATYYDPTVSRLREHLRKHGGVQLGRLLANIRNSSLRKRVYVEGVENGVPLMGGKQLTQLRPLPLAFVSRFLTKGLGQERVLQDCILVSCGGTVGRVSLVDRHSNNKVFTQDVMRLICAEGATYPGFLLAFLASAYGHAQLVAASYGSVQKKLRTFQIEDVVVALPPDRGAAIHRHVKSAVDARADAIDIEDATVALFSDAVTKGRYVTEDKWSQ